MKKILILGSSSNLALLTMEYLESVDSIKIFPLSRKKDFDYIKNMNRLKNYIEKIKPDIIINFCALNGVEKCSSNEKKAYEINAYFPNKILNLIIKKKIYLIHFSSDSVFAGKKKQLNFFDFFAISIRPHI